LAIKGMEAMAPAINRIEFKAQELQINIATIKDKAIAKVQLAATLELVQQNHILAQSPPILRLLKIGCTGCHLRGHLLPTQMPIISASTKS
jgi:hypothetical protein